MAKRKGSGGGQGDGAAGGRGQGWMAPYERGTRTTNPRNAGDKSRELKGPSVNSEATRKGTFPYPRTQGPRTA